MECPKCGDKMKVIDTRYRSERKKRYRIYTCKRCNMKYCTEEKILQESMKSYVYF